MPKLLASHKKQAVWFVTKGFEAAGGSVATRTVYEYADGYWISDLGDKRGRKVERNPARDQGWQFKCIVMQPVEIKSTSASEMIASLKAKIGAR